MRTAIELLLLLVLGAGMLIAAIAVALLLPDEKLQYFVLGYYVAVHHDLVLRIWRRLGIERSPTAQDAATQVPPK